MFETPKFMAGAALLAVLLIGYVPKALAQATATVVGRVQDAQGGVVPAAAVTLTSETRGTVFTTKSTSSGDFTFPNIPGDTYTVAVTLTGFKKVQRTGIEAVLGNTVAVPPITLEVGAVSETIEVSSEAPLVQTASGEVSSVVEQQTLENIPVSGTNFALQVALTPGVTATAASVPTRNDDSNGNVALTNFVLDGVSDVNNGNGAAGVSLNMDSIAEVRVLTDSYQAEYGRSSGLQVVGITKSGSDQLHGSFHDIEQHSGWNSNSWANRGNGVARSYSHTQYWGGTLGGPVGKPGKGQHKLFWFISEEVQPNTTGGSVAYFRVPTALERQGNFSQTTDNNGNLFNTITNTASGLPCSATSTAGCFGSGGTLGVIPASQLNAVGLAILNQYPTATTTGLNYNLEATKPRYTAKNFQSVERGDWNASPKLRISGKYAGQNSTVPVVPGTLPGFNDTVLEFPALIVPSVTVVYTFSPTFIFEGTVGYTRGDQTGSEPIDAAANRCNTPGSALCSFPNLYPQALKVPPGYETKVLIGENAPYYNQTTGYLLLAPQDSWGSRIANAPPNNPYPGFICWQYTIDTNLSLTKIWGKHTFKGGFSSQDNLKVQNLGTQGLGVLPIEGSLNFGNSTNNPLDTGFGYSNAAVGVFQSDAQQSRLLEGRYVYHNNDFYIQDNWKVTKKLTLDYGLRFVHNGPNYDAREQASNFFPNLWQASQAPQLFQPGCAVANQSPCSATNKVAVNPVTGASLGLGTSSIIGDIVPNTGNPLNGIVVNGKGIAKTNYSEPFLIFGPRFGAAYALTQKIVLRGAGGLLYDRPRGDAIYYQIGNPPFNSQGTVYNSTLAAVSAGTATAYQAPPEMLFYNYNANVPASFQFNFGAQFVLPWASLVDVSYVQSDNYNTVAWGTLGTPGGYNELDLNAPDLGAAYLPQNQDPTLGTSTIPGATAVTTNLMRPYRGYGALYDTWPRYTSLYSSIQASYKRNYRNGITAGFNYALGLRNTGNLLQQPIVQHTATSTGISESFSPVYTANASVINNAGLRRHTLKGYLVWAFPKVTTLGKAADYAVNGWQLSTVYTGGSGAQYDVGFSYTSNGANVNLTGSPQYVARIKIASNPGSGCSGNLYQEFNTSAFTGPTYGSVGNESGNEQFTACWDNNWDLALQRSFNVLSEKRKLNIRFDAFNVFNLTSITGISSTMTLASPAAPSTPTNNQFLANGALNTARITPQNAGFGAATAAQAMRTLQLTARFTF